MFNRAGRGSMLGWEQPGLLPWEARRIEQRVCSSFPPVCAVPFSMASAAAVPSHRFSRRAGQLVGELVSLYALGTYKADSLPNVGTAAPAALPTSGKLVGATNHIDDHGPSDQLWCRHCSNVNKWVLFTRGGGWCVNEEDCRTRSYGELGSTLKAPPHYELK